jgi:Ca2+-binding RTX toxin-like protein
MANLTAQSAFDFRVIATGKNPATGLKPDGLTGTIMYSNKVEYEMTFTPMSRAPSTDVLSLAKVISSWSAKIKGKPYFTLTDVEPNESSLSTSIEIEFLRDEGLGRYAGNNYATLMALTLHGDDKISGSNANDRLAGFAGDDTLNGGKGADVLTGGSGYDIFEFRYFGKRDADTVTDFDTESDLIALDRSVFKSLPAELSPEMLVVNAKPKALDANDWLLFDSAAGKLYYDADANGKGKPELIAKLTGVHDLDFDNFTMVSAIA